MSNAVTGTAVHIQMDTNDDDDNDADDANNDDTDNDDNDTQWTNHDCIDSLACMPDEPKPPNV